MHEESGRVSLEEALFRELRSSDIGKENLQELVGIVAGIQKRGLKGIKVFPKGIPPLPDGVRVSGVVEAGEVNRLLGEILTQTPRLTGVVLFPYGIPWPDIFRLTVDIGASWVNSNPMPGFVNSDPMPG